MDVTAHPHDQRGDQRQAQAQPRHVAAKAGLGLIIRPPNLFDLLGGAHVRVTEPRELHGVSVGEVAELRVIGFAERVWFGRAILYHPRGTRDALVEQARRVNAAGGDRIAVLDHAAQLRARVLRYRHVPAPRLYERGLDGKGDR